MPQSERHRYLTAEIVAMWIAYVLTLLGNAFIEGGRLGGTSSADIAYRVFTWFTTAGYVFAIWTLIYIAIAVWLVAYTRTAIARPSGFGTTSALFIISCVLNVPWLALWHFELVAVSFIVILADWFVLAALYLNVHRTMQTAAGKVPLSIYAAWITVATLANMAILVTRALDGGGPVFGGLSTILLTAGVLALGYVMRRRYDDIAVPLVFLWALVGVGVHVLGVSAPVSAAVFLLCIAGAVLTFVPIGLMRKPVHG